MSELTQNSDLIGQRQNRITKTKELISLGVNPYPTASYRTHKAAQIHDEYSDLENKEVVVSGRIMNIRSHGALAFMDLMDQSGTIQLYFKQDTLLSRENDSEYPEVENNQNLGWDELKLVDAGDIIEVRGVVTKTDRGMISVMPKTLKILTKSIRPMPTSHDGFNDTEERYRRRYLDTNLNEEVKRRFERRAKYWEAHREWFKQNGFLEMNIPALEHTTGGADAKPFVTHMDSLDETFYLRISQELYLKRLIGGGYEKVYEIGHRFRNEGFSDEHLPEHIAMEFYWAYADFNDGIEFTKEMFRYVYNKVYGTLKFNIRGFDVDLGKEWPLIDYVDVIKERHNVDIFNTNLEEIKAKLNANNVEYDPKTLNVNRGIDLLWKVIRKTIGGPAFVVGEPTFLSPLAKEDPARAGITQRFHTMIAGSELSNAYAELNDPQDQLNRFLDQQKLRESGDDEAQMLDIDFVEMLEYGMPPTFGYGHSERNFWFFEDVTAKEGVPFPTLKRSIDETTRKVYPMINFDEVVAPQQKTEPVVKKVISQKSKTQDTESRFIIVLNKNLESWQLTNTVAHIAGKLSAAVGDSKLRTREKFETKDGEIEANAQYPMISMKANSSEQLYNLLEKVEEAGFIHLAFTKEMIEFNLDSELAEEYSKKNKSELEYLGVGFFGKNEDLKNLTKKFKLWS